MKIQTIKAGFLKTICWDNNQITDWASSRKFSLDGNAEDFGNNYSFGDRAICSVNGEYTFIYERLSTKGLLLKNGVLIREINRSYYFADTYEYPAAFATVKNKTYLIHCPNAYNQLDLEDVETGEVVTNIPGRKPNDFFHSRLEVSADGHYLLSKGWVWHPVSLVLAFDLEACLNNPMLLDSVAFEPKELGEFCTASFIDNSKVVIGSSDESDDDWFPAKHLAVWDLNTGLLSNAIKIEEEFGNIFAINARYVWDTYKYPKIIDLHTGEVVDKNTEISSGLENSSINCNPEECPAIVFNRSTKQIALKGDERIEVLTPDDTIFTTDN